jgi:hypothetical protein
LDCFMIGGLYDDCRVPPAHVDFHFTYLVRPVVGTLLRVRSTRITCH